MWISIVFCVWIMRTSALEWNQDNLESVFRDFAAELLEREKEEREYKIGSKRYRSIDETIPFSKDSFDLQIELSKFVNKLLPFQDFDLDFNRFQPETDFDRITDHIDEYCLEPQIQKPDHRLASCSGPEITIELIPWSCKALDKQKKIETFV